MDNKNIIDSILSKLKGKKKPFLDEVELAVFRFINKTSINDCLTIVMRDSSGNIISTWTPKDVLDGYLPRFVAFMRKRQYKGLFVDSYLTDKVVEIVTNKFKKFYKSNTDLISKPLLEALLKDSVFVNTLSNHIIERAGSTLPSAIRSKLTTVLIHKLETSVSQDIVSSTANAISVLTAQVVGVATAIPITKSMAMLLMKYFAVLMKGTVAKVLASAAVKSMLAATVKKLVAVKILGALITLVASKLGLSASGTVIGIVVAPLLIAFIAHEINTLPKKLAEKVSKEVRNELDGQYTSVNRDIVTNIVKNVLGTGISVFANDVANDPEMKKTISELAKEISIG